jgi:hypothetical protein
VEYGETWLCSFMIHTVTVYTEAIVLLLRSLFGPRADCKQGSIGAIKWAWATEAIAFGRSIGHWASTDIARSRGKKLYRGEAWGGWI